VSDLTVQALGFALDGLTTQQQVLANNISNQDTPNFTASQVDFASSLQSAMANPGGGTASVSVTASADPAQADGNNVNITNQMTAAQQNSLQYQSVIEALTNTFTMRQTAQDANF
jgi:flagellar basal-body rod protein FlgB